MGNDTDLLETSEQSIELRFLDLLFLPKYYLILHSLHEAVDICATFFHNPGELVPVCLLQVQKS